jgi:hypothetical protein
MDSYGCGEMVDVEARLMVIIRDSGEIPGYC